MAPPSLVRIDRIPTVNQVPPYGPLNRTQIVQFWWQPPLDDGGYEIVAYYLNIYLDGSFNEFVAAAPTQRVFVFQDNTLAAKDGKLVYAEVYCLNDNGEYSPIATTQSVPLAPIPLTPSYPFIGLTSTTTAVASAYSSNVDFYTSNRNFVVQIQNPLTSNVEQYSAKWLGYSTGGDPGGGQSASNIRRITGLIEPWYRYTVRAYNAVDYDQPGLADWYPNWQYLKYPYKYTGVSSLQVWIDASQKPYFVYGGSTNGFSNYAFTNYTFQGEATIPANSNLSENYFHSEGSVIASPQITSNTQLSNEGFTYMTVIAGLAGSPLRSRWTAVQRIGFDGSGGKGFCQMDDTPFVPALTTLDSETDIYTVSRAPDTGYVTFRYNGSTISTSGEALSTLNDVVVQTQDIYSGTANVNEIIYYNSNLPLAARESLEGYIAWKWNLVGNLPPDHPYKNTKP